MHFNDACPFNVVLKVRWPSAASCELPPNCNWFYANAFVCCNSHSTHKHTYWCIHTPTLTQISLFRLVALIWGILLSLDIMLFCSTFGCGSKATFAFISMRRRSHVHTYVSKYVHVFNEHTYIYVCRSVWHSIDWHQNNRV